MLNLGTDKITALHLGGERIQKAYLGEALVFGAGTGPGPSRLPEGYTEVEYIESTGTQYIDTGVKPASNCKLFLDVYPLSVKKLSTYGVGYLVYSFFSRTSSPYTKYRMFVEPFEPRLLVGTSETYISLSNDTTPRRIQITIDCLQGKTFIDGGAEKAIASVVFNTAMSNISLLAFANPSAYVLGKIYSCQIEFNGVPSRDFVPCIDPTGAVGLYDLVDGKFYGNAGTGAFTAGPAV